MCANTYNTYENWKNEHQQISKPELYEPNNNVYFRSVEINDVIKKGYNAFQLYRDSHPNISLPNDKIKFNNSYFDTHDVAEVLRGDYSKLFFDLDGYDLDDCFKGLSQVLEMYNIIHEYYKDANLICFIECIDMETVRKVKEFTNCDIVYYNPYLYKEGETKQKVFTSHIFISGVYFSRLELKNLFECFNSPQKLELSTIAKCFDFSVVNTTKQKILRHVLSGKAIKSRKPNPEIPDNIKGLIMNEYYYLFCATKTENDKILIAEGSECFTRLKTYVNAKKLNKISESTIRKHKLNDYYNNDYIKDKGEEEINLNDYHKYNNLNNAQKEWYFNLVDLIKIDICLNNEITDNELFEKFIKVEYWYITQTHKNKVKNVDAVKSAIALARNSKSFNMKALPSTPCNIDINKFYERISKPITFNELKIYLNETFIMFNREDNEKDSSLYIAFRQNGLINTFNKKDYINKHDEDKNIILNYKITYTNSDNEICEVLISKNISFKNMFKFFNKSIKRLYDFDVYSLNDNILSLYEKPTKADKVELAQEWVNIFEDYSTEFDSDDSYKINNEKFNYVLDWFAYILQHPETRNKTILMINSLQGIGKNIVSNAICNYLGMRFSEKNANIDHICGSFNDGIDNKKLIIMNEVEKNTYANAIKRLIDDELSVNPKGLKKYQIINKCSLCIFTNEYDVNLIKESDRRFSFINCRATPRPKEFYASMFKDNDNLKDDLYNNLINHLLSRDLTNYKPNECKIFDKAELNSNREESRSAVYQIINKLMIKNNYKSILVNDLISILNNVKNSQILEDSISYAEEFEEYREELQQIKSINSRTIKNIINFKPEDKYDYVKCKERGEYRDKFIIRYKYLKNNLNDKSLKETFDI